MENIDTTGGLPYMSIYEPQGEREVFIPFEEVKATIVSVKHHRERAAHFFNPYLYKIKLEHGPHRWYIDRRYNDFRNLHNNLSLSYFAHKLATTLHVVQPSRYDHLKVDSLYYDANDGLTEGTLSTTAPGSTSPASVIVKFSREPTRRDLRRKAPLAKEEETEIKENKETESPSMPDMPKYSLIPDSMIGSERIGSRKVELQDYLNAVLSIPYLRQHKKMTEFLEVSRYSFVDDLGPKCIEGMVKKLGGGRHSSKLLTRTLACCCRFFCSRWTQQWLFVKDNFIGYCDPKTERIREVLLFDNDFNIKTLEDNEVEGVRHGFQISNFQRDLVLEAESDEEAQMWKEEVETILKSIGKIWIDVNQFGSFYPFHEQSYAQWFVDGMSMMEHAADMLELAEEEIFIADWFLTPELHLKRGDNDDWTHWQLMEILNRKAKQGVHVFVILFKEVELVMCVGSTHAKQVLKELDPKIMVFRHPDPVPINIWAHHEKVLVVDQCIAFAGGIDLCVGRWDNFQHRFTDLGTEDARDDTDNGTVLTLKLNEKNDQVIYENQSYIAEGSNVGPSKKLFIGKDYCNWIIKDIGKLDDYYTDLIDRTKIPRLPWHDVSSVVYGGAARDVARHFIQRWNQIKADKYKTDDFYPYLLPKSHQNDRIFDDFRRISHGCKAQVVRSGSLWSCGIKCINESIHQAYIHMIVNAKHYVYIENQYFMSMIGGVDIVNVVGKVLFERILKAHKHNETFRVFVVLPLLPAFPGELGTVGGRNTQTLLYWLYASICRGSHSMLENLKRENVDWTQYICFYSLRGHCKLGGRTLTELVYVHTKAMIVDDRMSIIGSANLNDRSFLGERDSEIDLYVEDTDMVESRMDGAQVDVGTFSSSFRKHLFAEHLGMIRDNGDIDESLIDLTDPICDDMFNFLKKIAKSNTQIYEKVFRCYPSDTIRTFADLEKCKAHKDLNMATINPKEANEHLSKIQGYLVEFPLDFLCDDELSPSLLTVEGWSQVITANTAYV